MNTKLLVSGIAAIAAWIIPASPVHAAFVLLDNFDSLNVGALNGQGGWIANTKTSIVNTGGTDNAASIATGAGSNLANYHALGGLSISNSSTAATVYWNFSISSAATGGSPASNNWNFILTDVAAPGDTAGSSEVQFNWDGSTGGVRVNDNGNFKGLTLEGTTAFLPLANTLYNSWFEVNNAANTYSIFLQSDADARVATRTQLLLVGGAGTFTFRNGAANNDLVTFNFGSSGAGSVVQVDDIYVDTAGVNTANPVPEPGSISILALAGLAICNRRRRG